MQKPIRQFVEICTKFLDFRSPIYEFGALNVNQSDDADLRSLFGGATYVGADMRAGPGVDKILNLHDIDVKDEAVGSVICLDTIEHVEYPRKGIEEIYRVLAADGILILSSVFEFPIHGYPNDFWRFTPEGFRSLLREFSSTYVFSFGRSCSRPQSVVAVAFKGKTGGLEEFLAACKKWEEWNSAVVRALAKKSV